MRAKLRTCVSPLPGCLLDQGRLETARDIDPIHVTPAPAGASGMRKYDIVVTDAAGLVLVKLHGFSARPLVKAAPEPARVLQYFDYAWEPAPTAPRQ